MNIFVLVGVQLAVFIVIIIIIKRIIYSASSVEVHRLQNLSRLNEEKAREMEEKYRENETAISNKRLELQAEARDIIEAARREALRLKEEISEEAGRNASEIIAQANESKEEIKREAEAMLFPRSISLALSLIREAMSGDGFSVLHRGVLDEMLCELAKMKDRGLYVDSSLDRAEVISARKLDADSLEQVKMHLSRITGRDLNISEKVSEEIIAGARITAGGLVLDGSLEGKLKDKAKNLRNGAAGDNL